MKNIKNRESLFKVLLILGCIFLVTSMVFIYLLENTNPEATAYNLYNILAVAFFVTSFILGAIIFSLMGKVKITYKKLKPQKIPLNTDKYDEFEKKFIDTLYNCGYEKYKEIPNILNSSIKYLINKKWNINNVILIVRQSELTEQTVKNYFEYCLNHIVEEEPYLSKKNTNLIHILCVDKTNDNFIQFTERNVEQGYGRFNLSIGISFDSRMIYITAQKSDLFIARYEKLVKMFKEYIKNQIANDK
jgi:hypothetical protein